MWKDPRNLTKDTILELCNHIRLRQEEYGSEEGFRFHAYYDGNDMVQVDYGGKTDDERAAARAKKQQNARKEKRAQKGKGKQIPHSSTSTPIGTSPMVLDHQIDPALLVGNISSTITSIVDTNCHHDIGVFIGEDEMQLLISNGFPSTIPINGPGDGLPRYYVPATAVDKLKRIVAASKAQTASTVDMQTNSLLVPLNNGSRG